VDFPCALGVQNSAKLQHAAQVVGAVKVGGRVSYPRPAGGRVAVDGAGIAVAGDGDEGVDVAVVRGEKLEVGTGGPGKEWETEGGLQAWLAIGSKKGVWEGAGAEHTIMDMHSSLTP
jgi:hypothetical protein